MGPFVLAFNGLEWISASLHYWSIWGEHINSISLCGLGRLGWYRRSYLHAYASYPSGLVWWVRPPVRSHNIASALTIIHLPGTEYHLPPHPINHQNWSFKSFVSAGQRRQMAYGNQRPPSRPFSISPQLSRVGERKTPLSKEEGDLVRESEDYHVSSKYGFRRCEASVCLEES